MLHVLALLPRAANDTLVTTSREFSLAVPTYLIKCLYYCSENVEYWSFFLLKLVDMHYQDY